MNAIPPRREGDDLPRQSSEWDEPVGPDARLRAAIFVWILGGLTVVLCGCCSALLGVMGMMSDQELEEAARQPLPPEYFQFKQQLPTVALGVLILGFVPGVLYLFLGFGVHKGRSAPTGIALVLAATQAIALAGLAAWDMIAAIRMGNPSALTFVILILGTPLLLLGFAIRWLLAAQQMNASHDVNHDDDLPHG